jgi:hypothetical protein
MYAKWERQLAIGENTMRPAQVSVKDSRQRFSFRKRLKEISMFFKGDDEVHRTMRRLANRLKRAGVSYAIVGGMALNAHRYQRTTKDVNVLLTREGFELFRRTHVGKNYTQAGARPKRFIDRANNVTLDVLVTGLYPGTGKPGPIKYPDPAEVSEVIDKIQVVNLATLVQLKLAARRWRDFADVVELIRFNELDESFLEKLHPSVRQDFTECLEEKRREDEYEAQG